LGETSSIFKDQGIEKKPLKPGERTNPGAGAPKQIAPSLVQRNKYGEKMRNPKYPTQVDLIPKPQSSSVMKDTFGKKLIKK
jgi:hypothetical protein